MELFDHAMRLLPMLLLPLFAWVAKRVLDYLRAHQQEKWVRVVYAVVSTAVDAVEQQMAKESPAVKKAAAIQSAQDQLRAVGIKVPSSVLSDQIEGALLQAKRAQPPLALK